MASSENKKGFISWGTGLVIGIVLFMTSTLGFVVYATTAFDFDLVTDHHYEEGVKYQQVIDRMENAHKLSHPVQFSYSKSDHTLRVSFPEDVDGIPKDATLTLYRPDDASLDQNTSMTKVDQNDIALKEVELAPGKWTAQLNWNADGVNYYSESTIFVD
jgi:hypothetical protein